MPEVTLDEDSVDDILYMARANETSELETYLSELSAQTGHPKADLVAAAVDQYSKNGALHYAAANGHVGTLTPSEAFEWLGDLTKCGRCDQTIAFSQWGQALQIRTWAYQHGQRGGKHATPLGSAERTPRKREALDSVGGGCYNYQQGWTRRRF